MNEDLNRETEEELNPAMALAKCVDALPEDLTGLEDAVVQLHTAVNHLIWIIHENADFIPQGREILDKLPLLDFYNQDLITQLENLQRKLSLD